MCRFIVCNNEILDNLKEVRKRLNRNTLVCAVVKADAYGFGMAKICHLLKSRVDYFAVARVSEFLKYKELGIDKPCLILSPLQNREYVIAIKEKAEITIDNCEDLEYVIGLCKNYNTSCKIHLKIDTGMNRYGIKTKEMLIKILEKIKESAVIDLVGCYSHLYNAQKTQFVEKQKEKFVEFKEIILSLGFSPIFHIANSIGSKDSSLAFDMVRIGYSLYTKGKGSEHKFICEVSSIKKINKGEIVSYCGTFKAKKDMLIAVCNAGYADGVNRHLSNKGRVIINGKYCKILGNICMDSFMVDISDVDDVKKGDEVIIFGVFKEKSISVCDLARLCATIPYEIYTSISKRVKRVYRWRRYEYYNRKIQGESFT